MDIGPLTVAILRLKMDIGFPYVIAVIALEIREMPIVVNIWWFLQKSLCRIHVLLANQRYCE